MKERIKILWLPAWYPSRVDFFNGDFVHRHAIAATKFVDVILIFVVKDELLISSSTSIHFEEKDGIFIYTAYYNSSVKNLFLKKIIFGFLYFKLLFKLYGQAKKAHFNFNLIHVQIASKQGLFALWLKFTKGIKYVITEHSGWFMPIGSNFFTTSIFQKAIIKLNFKYASAIHVVSNSLGVELRKRYSFIKFFTVIPNVVDSSVFYYNNQATNKHTLQFLAINGYSFQKNVDGVIRAFSAYLQKGYNAFLHVAGPNDDHLKILAKNLDSKDTIKFYGVIDSSSIASLMQEADALLFFTRFESLDRKSVV